MLANKSKKMQRRSKSMVFLSPEFYLFLVIMLALCGVAVGNSLTGALMSILGIISIILVIAYIIFETYITVTTYLDKALYKHRFYISTICNVARAVLISKLILVLRTAEHTSNGLIDWIAELIAVGIVLLMIAGAALVNWSINEFLIWLYDESEMVWITEVASVVITAIPYITIYFIFSA